MLASDAGGANSLARDARRPIRVHFSATVSHSIPWKFRPLQKEVTCVPGEPVLAFFNATNMSDEPLIGISTYNVTPQKAGVYFNKIQCFCFEEQQLQPHESVDMPVFFFIDPDFVKDPNMEGVETLTLSYTFFKVTESVYGPSSSSSSSSSTATPTTTATATPVAVATATSSPAS